MARSKLLRVLGDLAPVSYRDAYLAVADPQDLIDLHKSGLAGRTGCRRLFVVGTRSYRNGLDVEAVGSVRQVIRLVQPKGFLITDDPTQMMLETPTLLTGIPGSLDARLPQTFTVLRGRTFTIALNYQPPLVWEKIERHHLSIIQYGTPRWSDPPTLHGQTLRRWTSHRPPLKNVLELAADHPAVVKGRTMFPSRVFDPADVQRVLIPGENSRKIGGRVTKGPWKNSRIFTLSLEERASCPRSCAHWRSCYTNHMPFTKRLRHGPALVERIEQELIELTERYPEGVVIRLHVSGDFWSVGYVRQWVRWLRRFGNLRAFGYPRIHRDPGSDQRSRPLQIDIGPDSPSGSLIPLSKLGLRTPSSINQFNRLSAKESSAPHRPLKLKHAEHALSAGALRRTLLSWPTDSSAHRCTRPGIKTILLERERIKRQTHFKTDTGCTPN